MVSQPLPACEDHVKRGNTAGPQDRGISHSQEVRRIRNGEKRAAHVPARAPELQGIGVIGRRRRRREGSAHPTVLRLPRVALEWRGSRKAPSPGKAPDNRSGAASDAPAQAASSPTVAAIHHKSGRSRSSVRQLTVQAARPPPAPLRKAVSRAEAKPPGHEEPDRRVSSIAQQGKKAHRDGRPAGLKKSLGHPTQISSVVGCSYC